MDFEPAREVLKKVLDAKGVSAVRDILAAVGATKLSEVAPDRVGELIRLALHDERAQRGTVGRAASAIAFDAYRQMARAPASRDIHSSHELRKSSPPNWR